VFRNTIRVKADVRQAGRDFRFRVDPGMRWARGFVAKIMAARGCRTHVSASVIMTLGGGHRSRQVTATLPIRPPNLSFGLEKRYCETISPKSALLALSRRDTIRPDPAQ
jgi:hypothetical protein